MRFSDYSSSKLVNCGSKKVSFLDFYVVLIDRNAYQYYGIYFFVCIVILWQLAFLWGFTAYKAVAPTSSHPSLERTMGAIGVIISNVGGLSECRSSEFSRKCWFWVPYNCFVELHGGRAGIPKIGSQIHHIIHRTRSVPPLPNMLMKFSFHRSICLTPISELNLAFFAFPGGKKEKGVNHINFHLWHWLRLTFPISEVLSRQYQVESHLTLLR